MGVRPLPGVGAIEQLWMVTLALALVMLAGSAGTNPRMSTTPVPGPRALVKPLSMVWLKLLPPAVPARTTLTLNAIQFVPVLL